MLEWIFDLDDDILKIVLKGRLDTVTAPDLEKALDEKADLVNRMIFDCTDLIYMSSAGLRLFLTYYKKLRPKGGMEIRNVSKPVQEVFEITGFDEFLVLT